MSLKIPFYTPFQFPTQEIVYKRVSERKLKLHLFESHSLRADKPAILFFHGGSFSTHGGALPQFQYHAHHFAEKGYVSIIVDCHNGSDVDFTPFRAIEDARSAFEWVLDHAPDLGVDSQKVVMCGASSGGYTVLCSVMIDVYRHDHLGRLPAALVILNAGVDGVEITNRLYPAFNARAIAELSPLHHVKTGLPPMVWFVGTADVIYADNQRFCERWVENGNACTFYDYDGMDHGFFNYGRYDNVPYNDVLSKMDDFLSDALVKIGGDRL